jgi:Domain of unknown function (DUF4124)
MRCLLCLVGLWALSLPAHGQIFECVDEGGVKRFTNIVAEAKGCKALNILPTEPPPPPPSAPATGAPRTQGKSVPPATSANFPRIDRATQQARDNDRRRILEQELSVEHKLLEQARQELAADQAAGSQQPARIEAHQRRIRMHEDNVASLRREISNLR